MRGKLAKQIRKATYGDMSHRGSKYLKHRETGQIIVAGIRQEYKQAKRYVKEIKRRFGYDTITIS